MKKLNIKKTGLLILLGIFSICVITNAQEIKPEKMSKKEAKKAKSIADFYSLDSLLNFKSYVLEANYLENKYGSMVVVTSTLNFIRVTGYNGVLQTGSDFRMGYNSVGGVTAEGTVSNYKIDRDLKNLRFTVTFNLFTNLGNFDVMMNVSCDSNATATITGTTSGRLTWKGYLVPLNKSRVFKGMNTI
jgi:hypothetical protein